MTIAIGIPAIAAAAAALGVVAVVAAVVVVVLVVVVSHARSPAAAQTRNPKAQNQTPQRPSGPLGVCESSELAVSKSAGNLRPCAAAFIFPNIERKAGAHL